MPPLASSASSAVLSRNGFSNKVYKVFASSWVAPARPCSSPPFVLQSPLNCTAPSCATCRLPSVTCNRSSTKAPFARSRCPPLGMYNGDQNTSPLFHTMSLFQLSPPPARVPTSLSDAAIFSPACRPLGSAKLRSSTARFASTRRSSAPLPSKFNVPLKVPRLGTGASLGRKEASCASDAADAPRFACQLSPLKAAMARQFSAPPGARARCSSCCAIKYSKSMPAANELVLSCPFLQVSLLPCQSNRGQVTWTFE